jgi:hypothetical protein
MSKHQVQLLMGLWPVLLASVLFAMVLAVAGSLTVPEMRDASRIQFACASRPESVNSSTFGARGAFMPVSNSPSATAALRPRPSR